MHGCSVCVDVIVCRSRHSGCHQPRMQGGYMYVYDPGEKIEMIARSMHVSIDRTLLHSSYQALVVNEMGISFQ